MSTPGIAPLLRVSNLEVRYRRQVALRELSFELEPGDTLGIVGESGSGKSTLVRALLGLVPIAGGDIAWRGRSVTRLGTRQWRLLRRLVQPVFQDPLASLDPRMCVRALLAEPLLVHRADGRAERERRIAAMLERVGLDPAVLSRHPHELSGGQCQRICIARAMILEPSVLVCDEPVSALDVSIQAQIMNLLAGLHADTGLTLLLVSHNLAVVRRLCRRLLVLRQGRVVEAGATDELLEQPADAYTRRLIAAVPAVPRRRLAGESPPARSTRPPDQR
ncbi:MAG: ABC transporter ATP-binding protein [Steroidobacteraceae bacterium]|nr:ABC transporter ATP-binding protein [Steroidobacteraceae bacterium]